MAKKKVPGVPNKTLYCRLSFMYQAASFLATESATHDQGPNRAAPQDTTDPDMHMEVDGDKTTRHDEDKNRRAAKQARNMSHRLLADFRSVSLKSQIRVSPEVKRTICKFCDTLLIEGQTCTSAIENTSKGGKKPWADVLVIMCHTCHRAKHYPVNAPRQKRRPLRIAKEDALEQSAKQGAADQPQPQPQKSP